MTRVPRRILRVQVGHRGRVPEGADGLSVPHVLRLLRDGAERASRLLPHARRCLQGAGGGRLSGGEWCTECGNMGYKGGNMG